MRTYIILCLTAFLSAPFLSAQDYQVKAYYKDGRMLNFGSSKTVNYLSTEYDSNMSHLLKLNIKEGDVSTFVSLGSPWLLDSISFVPDTRAMTIYRYLQLSGNYTYTLRLIDELGYAEALNGATDNYTLFAANDQAWKLFLASTACPVNSYEQLSNVQKRRLLEPMLLPGSRSEISLTQRYPGISYSVNDPARAFRQPNLSAVEATYTSASGLPRNSYWDALREKGGAYLSHPVTDAMPSVVFTAKYCKDRKVTSEDMQFITAKTSDGGMYFFNTPAEESADCLNGYVYQLAELSFPPSAMDEELKKVADCSLFSSLLDLYTMPTVSDIKKVTLDGTPIYRKAYFAQNGQYALQKDSLNIAQPQLLFDPSWQRSSYSTGDSFQDDMSALFVPTNKALEEWRSSSTGQMLMHGYSSWEDVPRDLLVRLLNNHMKTSFIGSLPSAFDKVLNDGNREQCIRKEDIATDAYGNKMVFPANNGVIYVINKVYTPDSYVTVWAPCLNVENLRIMGWALFNSDKTTYIPDGYGTYLNSMENTFAFVVPTDEALLYYRDPFYSSIDGSYKRISFKYNESARTVTATTTLVKPGIDEGIPSSVDATKVKTLLKDLLDNCIIPMDRNDWSKGGYYKSIGGTYVAISSFQTGATVLSGGNVENGETPEVITFYNQSNQILNGEHGSGGNGATLVVNKVIQPTRCTVIDALKSHPEFSEFVGLLTGFDELISTKYHAKPDSLMLYQALILPKKAGTQTITSNTECVGFLQHFDYTLYAPTNAAMMQAYTQGLPRWTDLETRPHLGEGASDAERARDLEARKVVARKIMDFIRYHFQLVSVCTDGNSGYYKTNAFNREEKVFHELQVHTDHNGMSVASRMESDSKANVLPALQNIMAREYTFEAVPSSSTAFNSISSVVIHGVDAPLFFSEKEGDGKRKQFK